MKCGGLVAYGFGVADIAAGMVMNDWLTFIVGIIFLIIGAIMIDLGGD